jgi:O-antigen ligase
VLVALIGFGFVKVYGHVAPRTHFTAAELRYQEQHAHQNPQTSHDATSANEASTSEHLASLRDGLRTVIRHPWGYGIGNAGVTAERTNVKVEAGESTYTEVGAETGLLGALVFVAWMAALFYGLRFVPWLAAAFAAMAFVALQTDMIGIPWLGVVLFAFVGVYLPRKRDFSATFP